MKEIIVFVLFSTLFYTPAFAEDAAVDIYAAAQEKTIITPASTAPVKTVQQPVIQAPKLSREDNASLHLSILQDEVDNMTKVGFFGSLFSENEELQQTLMQDIQLFLRVYHDLPITAEALVLKGRMLAKQNHPEAASIAWLQTMYEYPKSDASIKAKHYISDLVENDWRDYSADIKAVSKYIPNEDKASRLRKLINLLFPFDDRAMVRALSLLQLDFLTRFPDDIHADEIQVLLAHNLGAESAESGIFGFKKLLALYPNSSYRPEAMLAIADLQRLRLKEYEKAASNYKVMIEKYPQHKLVKNAYENLALTQAEHLKKYKEAIQTYHKIVELYPEDKLGLTALQNIATLQARKTNEPYKAVVTLRKLAKMFHGQEAVEALNDAIKFSRKKIKDKKLTFEVRQQLVTDYPKSDKAPKALFAMAEYAEKDLQDAAQAKALYEQLITQYPDHKLAKKARDRIK